MWGGKRERKNGKANRGLDVIIRKKIELRKMPKFGARIESNRQEEDDRERERESSTFSTPSSSQVITRLSSRSKEETDRLKKKITTHTGDRTQGHAHWWWTEVDFTHPSGGGVDSFWRWDSRRWHSDDHPNGTETQEQTQGDPGCGLAMITCRSSCVCACVCACVDSCVCVCTDRNRLHWKKKKKRKAFEMKTNSKKFATSRASFGAHDDNDVDEWDKWRRQKTFRIFSAASSSSLFLFLLLLLFLIVTVVLTDVGKGLTEG